ncbi:MULTISPECIES: DUF1177 domain-containing protein [Pantoea]|uniref:DUF1177 domain-containing protein n=1 Tax=Candidatus Pantoea gossypiicola TaxID=2608008 RepID=A0AB34CI91_9GAMM|nr:MULTISPECIES: DUF1177 domain-containing protein [Pantoea]KAA5928601.1 DUF1177 domain-containing protein [Pantoea sp. VH_8]KAA5933804.1 DUF1177 domain-containing protein [Pantoea sp. VH_4]KAA5985852.1 DUF1177 domain-containing protein [Pantoea sp. M_4]KAA6123259.1 DUF1177 domain-containing protein [Pantoea gossypiicola]
MSLQQTLAVFELLDSAHIDGQQVVDLFTSYPDVMARFTRVTGPKGRTDFVRIDIPGTEGKSGGGTAPTLGIIGRLGGIGARPGRIGMVSDADGAIAAIASALKLAQMQSKGDRLAGDVIITTHICPDAPTRPHQPVDFMDSPIDDVTMNDNEVVTDVDAILSIDTTKGNRIINHKGFALSPTVKEGYILRVSEDLLRIMEMTSGRPAVTFPITTQDITPYGNGVYHLNSILQPSTATDVPVVGVAITAESVVPGCGTGASHEVDIAAAAKFAIEVAKEFGRGTCHFYDAEEYARLITLYGSLAHLRHRNH